MTIIQCTNVTKKFKNSKALNNLTFSIEENKITGVVGRNGAGKTTIFNILSGLNRQTSGEVKVFTEEPFNSLTVSANSILVDDMMYFPASLNLSEILKEAAIFYGNWDATFAKRLFDHFSFDYDQSHEGLSKGKKSTFNMIFGLASRSPLTIFDEPTTGMDEAVRKDFYRALLKDYIAYPRTILLSSHHLNEIEGLLEEVLLIHEGEALIHIAMEDLKNYAIGFRGSNDLLDKWTQGQMVLYRKKISQEQSYVVLKHNYSDENLQQARINGLEISPVSPSDVCIYLTGSAKGGIDDVFNEG